MLEKNIEIVKAPCLNLTDPTETEGVIKLFKKAPPGIKMDSMGKWQNSSLVNLKAKIISSLWPVSKHTQMLYFQINCMYNSRDQELCLVKRSMKNQRRLDINCFFNLDCDWSFYSSFILLLLRSWFQFRHMLRSVAVDGSEILVSAKKASQRSLARLEAREAAAKAKAKREEERVQELKKVRGEKWLPSIARQMKVSFDISMYCNTLF